MVVGCELCGKQIHRGSGARFRGTFYHQKCIAKVREAAEAALAQAKGKHPPPKRTKTWPAKHEAYCIGCGDLIEVGQPLTRLADGYGHPECRIKPKPRPTPIDLRVFDAAW